jgi:hypothetical protein
VGGDEPLSVHELITQSRKFIYLRDVVKVCYQKSLYNCHCRTGTKLVEKEPVVRPEMKLVKHYRGSSETLVEDFSVGISTKADLDPGTAAYR